MADVGTSPGHLPVPSVESIANDAGVSYLVPEFAEGSVVYRRRSAFIPLEAEVITLGLREVGQAEVLFGRRVLFIDVGIVRHLIKRPALQGHFFYVTPDDGILAVAPKGLSSGVAGGGDDADFTGFQANDFLGRAGGAITAGDDAERELAIVLVAFADDDVAYGDGSPWLDATDHCLIG